MAKIMNVEPAEFVKFIEENHEKAKLVNDAKARTWSDEAEHALLRLANGKMALVRGGRDGIQFIVRGEGDRRTLQLEIAGGEFQVDRILWHTHPQVTGPSDGDLEALAILKQDASLIYEIGGSPDGTRITPKSKPRSD